jgi:hypothetical protein
MRKIKETRAHPDPSDRDELWALRSRSRASGQLHRPVVVAMIAMRMMQMPVHEVIDVIAMRNGFVPAARAMRVRAASLGSAVHGIGGADGDDMLVDMILMHVVEMPVV